MWRGVKVSWGFLTPRQKTLVAVLTFARIIANLFDLAGIAAIGLLVMALASGRIDFSIGNFYRLRIDETPFELIIGLVILAAVSFLVKAVVTLGLNLMILRVLVNAEVRSSRRILDYLLTSPLSEMRKYSLGDIQFAANQSTTWMYSGLVGAASAVVAEVALMLTIAGAFFLVNPVAALVVTAYILVLVAIIQWLLGRRLKQIGRDVTKGNVESTGIIFDAITTFREIAVLRKQPYFLRKFTESRALLGRTRSTELVLRTVPRIIIEQALMLGVLAFVGWQLLLGDVTTGLASTGVFVAGAIRILGAVLPVQTSLATIKSNQLKAQKAQEILRKHREKFAARYDTDRVRPPRVRRESETYSGVHEPGSGIGVSVDQVSFRFSDADKDTIEDISLTIEPGSFVAFVGPSGAGKTTLVDIILGLNTPREGDVLVDGVDPLELRVKNPGVVSYVPQNPGMVQGSIAENVALGIEPDAIDMDRVRECLELVDLHHTVGALPEGINTSLGKQSDALSGGQIQRLGLARALYSRPRLIALDEATSALDAGSEHAVSQNIMKLGGEVTVIVIAHRLSTIQGADRVFVIEDGRISGQGTFKEVRKQVPMIEEYVKLMSFDD